MALEFGNGRKLDETGGESKDLGASKGNHPSPEEIRERHQQKALEAAAALPPRPGRAAQAAPESPADPADQANREREAMLNRKLDGEF